MRELTSFASLLFLVSLIACGWGAGQMLGPPTVDVSGTWEMVPLNADIARYTACEGNMRGLRGMTIAEAWALAPECTLSGPIVAVQTGDTFVIPAVLEDCDNGASNTLSGGGAVGENVVNGQFDTLYLQVITKSNFFDGTMVGDSISLSVYAETLDGELWGRCSISPALEYEVSVAMAGVRRPGRRSR